MRCHEAELFISLLHCLGMARHAELGRSANSAVRKLPGKVPVVQYFADRPQPCIKIVRVENKARDAVLDHLA